MSDSIALLFYFLALVAILHCLMIFVLPRRQLFWKKTDYAWLLVATLGLLGLLQKSRNMQFADSLPFVESRAKTLTNIVRWEVGGRERMCRDSAKMLEAVQGEREKQRKEDYIVLARWYKTVLDTLDAAHRSPPLPDQLQELVSTVPGENNLLSEQKAWLKPEIDEIIKADNDLKLHREMLEYSTMEKWWIIASPWIVALAIAIRVTKVSAEVFGFDRPRQQV